MYKSEIIFHWIDVLSSFSCCRGEGGGEEQEEEETVRGYSGLCRDLTSSVDC